MRQNRSSEDYLETILILTNQNGSVRSIDIANYMKFSKPSVSIAMKHLKEDGFIEVSTAGHITLTEKGNEIAGRIYERHLVLSGMLKALGVSPETAAEDACEMEHVISEETFRAIRDHYSSHTSN